MEINTRNELNLPFWNTNGFKLHITVMNILFLEFYTFLAVKKLFSHVCIKMKSLKKNFFKIPPLCSFHS